MLAARGQENLAFTRQNGPTLKQQQGQAKTPGARYPKTPMKIPLNDENGAHAIGGAKSVLGGKARGNENAMTSKGLKGADKSNFVTPMEPRTRAVLGNKTTNAKAKALQTVNAKSTVKELEKSQSKAPTTVKPRQKQPQAASQKLQVHAEEVDPLGEEEVEYCPPRPKDLPYESDVLPDGVMTFDGLKPENMFKGYYGYYFNPVDEHGVSLADRQLEEKNRKAMEECDRRIKEDIDNFEWSLDDELDIGSIGAKKASIPAKDPTKSAAAKQSTIRKAPSTIRSRNAASALSMDDTTKSLQRKAAKPLDTSKLPRKKASSFAIPSLRGTRQPNAQRPSIPKKTSMEIKGIEANSKMTIGYNKGRSTASILAQGTTKPHKAPKSTVPPSGTTLSNDSDKTITPASFAQKQASAAAEDQQWRERVPFLSIFNPEDDEDDDDCDLLAGGLPQDLCEEEEEEFEFKLAD